MKKTKKAALKSAPVWRRAGSNYYVAKVGAFTLTVEMYRSGLPDWDWAILFKGDVLISGVVTAVRKGSTVEGAKEQAQRDALASLQHLAEAAVATGLVRRRP